MALSKVNYVDNQTIITAQNLNDIQNEIIQNTELIKKAAPRNLLDNSDFRNPVNQRGITVCAVGAYGLDRWLHINDQFTGTVSFTTDANGTTFVASDGTLVGLIQRFIDKNYYDGKYTAAIKTGDGSILIGVVQTENAEAHMQRAVFWFPTGTTVVWAALYNGEYTAETLPEYHPKGYGAELLECQRYYYRRNFLCALHPANKSNLSEFRGEVKFPVEMRTNPQCTFDQSEGNVVTGPVNNQFCLLVGTPNESGWCTTGSRLEFIADL